MKRVTKTNLQIARELGITKQSVSLWFLKRTKPTKANMKALTFVFDMTLDEVNETFGNPWNPKVMHTLKLQMDKGG